MLTQLEKITNQFELSQAKAVLMEQAILLAMRGKLEWKSTDVHDCSAEALLSLPGEEPTPTLIRLYLGDGGDFGRPGYYLKLGDDASRVCRNDADPKIEYLSKLVFGEERKAA